MKLLLILYIIFGFIVPLGILGMITLDAFTMTKIRAKTNPGVTLANYTTFGITIILDIGQIILKLCLIGFTFKFLQHSSGEKEEETALRQRLLPSEELLKKRPVE